VASFGAVDAAAISMQPIGVVAGGRTEPIDDNWGDVECDVVLDGERFGPDVLAGLEAFSHVDVVFVFDRVRDEDVSTGARYPRGRTDWPAVGIFAQRARMRPNRIGVTTCELVAVDGLRVRVRGLDAIDGSPVLDLKPYMPEFGPRGSVHEPQWASELMQDYW
jgi:tRNA-Thr(GGU) m(6)t(6)A37 methyltransferase TsaA